jgi:hypothetical protein
LCRSNNLGKEATLMLTFDGDMEGLYEDFFLVVWKYMPLLFL